MKRRYFKDNTSYFKFYNKNKDCIIVFNIDFCYNKKQKLLSSICLIYDIIK